jgi:cyclic pyranopterin phosphate synthase
MGSYESADAGMTGTRLLIDSHGRILRDLRVSLTDRCNFRCLYCLPETEAAQNFYRGHWARLPNPAPIVQQWMPRANILSFEEIERAVRIAVRLGIQKIRLTGGEPLLRHHAEDLVARLAAVPGLTDLAMTTNGFLFPEKARALRAAGLRRVSLSLDSLDRDNFRKITGRDGLNEILTAIQLARDLGFHPVKVNAVIIRDINDHEIEALAEFAREREVNLRFIEFMPLDSARAWQKEMVVPGHEILARLQSRFAKPETLSSKLETQNPNPETNHTLVPVPPANKSETAKRWTFPDGRGEIGIIAPVSEPFCGHCNRIRLTADGKIRTCLFSVIEHDLRGLLRGEASDEAIGDWLQAVVLQKEARHHIGEPEFVPPPRSMSCIGG